MGAQARYGSVTLSCLCLLVSACGGDSDRREPGAAQSGVERPLYPTCGTEGFARPRPKDVTTPDTRGRAWSLSYRRSPGGAAGGDASTTFVLVLETSPTGPRPEPKDPKVRRVTIAGRRVLFRAADERSENFSAQWGTSRAYYTVLANGRTSATIKRFIRCLP